MIGQCLSIPILCLRRIAHGRRAARGAIVRHSAYGGPSEPSPPPARRTAATRRRRARRLSTRGARWRPCGTGCRAPAPPPPAGARPPGCPAPPPPPPPRAPGPPVPAATRLSDQDAATTVSGRPGRTSRCRPSTTQQVTVCLGREAQPAAASAAPLSMRNRVVL